MNVTSGNVAQRIDYDCFGRVVGDTNPGFQPFGFAGGLYDGDTGLVRFGARDYDPSVGRWTAKDPIGFRGGDSDLYAYAANDSPNLVDPSGLAPFYNGSSSPVHVSGNVGPGHGDGEQVQFVVPPGGLVDANHPYMTDAGPVSDVDFVDFGDTGAAHEGGLLALWPRGDKILGSDEGLQCSVIDNPFGRGTLPYPSGFVFNSSNAPDLVAGASPYLFP